MIDERRQVFSDRLVVVDGASVLNVGALAYLSDVLECFCNGDFAYDRYRRQAIETLFYGDWRRWGRFEIVGRENNGRALLLQLECSIGMRCMFAVSGPSALV